jgi:GTPase SAR1 family protein
MGSDQSKDVPIDDATSFERLREIARMDQMIRSRIRGGIQYNMKIILRGERGSGKTTLWKRFQGLSFVEQVNITLVLPFILIYCL